MKKILKWTGIGLGSLLALVLIAAAVLYAIGSSKFNKSHQINVETIAIPTDSTAVARGEHLVMTMGCVECHGNNLAGNLFIDEAPMGKISASNLTSGAGGIGNSYSDADWVRAIRHGVKRNGQAIVIMPSNFYLEMNAKELGDLIAYLKQTPPVDNVLPEREMGPIARLISGVSDELLPANTIDHSVAIPKEIQPEVTATYGEYKAIICRACHGENLAGGLVHGPPGTPASKNITPDAESGIGKWSEADFFSAVRDGVRPNGEEINPAMPRWVGNMTDDELRAIWLYLQSVPPVHTDLAKQ